jgi:hypothetical protein|tara:strand:- start:3070 stop:3231 length:162 start_codon:yes stop_codon:yes gene_type:complete
MKILVKQLPQEVTTIKGHIVYVMNDDGRPIEADVCDLIDLKEVIENFKLKYDL